MVDEKKALCVLSGEAAIKLWDKGKGREKWSAWVKENPIADVDFSGVDFSKYRAGNKSPISFEGFAFPSGEVNFSRAKFGDGAVIFHNTVFGPGNVRFWGAKFGDGDVSFWGAKFGDGDVFFIDAEFGDGDVSFNSTEFGNGSVNFKSAEFGEGEVRFIDAKFGDAELALENVNCKGRFYLSYIDNAPVTSFRNAAFDNAVMIDRVSFRGVPDFVNTKLTHQLSLHGLEFTLNRASRFHLKAKDEDGVEQLHNKFREVIEGKQVSTDISRYLGMKRAHVGFFKRATWAKDAERLNRLKELAENNKHHDLAMRCHADEHRAKRWHEMSAPASLLDMAFSVSCNYGQSIWRPILVLVVLIISVTVPYTLLSDSLEFAVNFNSEMLAFSAANSIPFLTSAREASKSGIEQFYEGQDSLAWVYITMMLQGLASFILLFLIGLGLRNRFRL